MQQHKPTILCQSERGYLAVLDHGMAYSFSFKNIALLLAADEVDVFRQQLESLEEPEWLLAPTGRFVLLPIARLNACFYLTQAEVDEMVTLLLEAAAMVKVHQRLFNRV